MAYLDKDGARELVSKHRDLFAKMASSGKGNIQEKIRKIVNQAYIVMLLLKCTIITGLWWLFSLIDPFYGTFFLFATAILGSKRNLDRNFSEADSNLLEALEEENILSKDSGEEKDGEKENKEESSTTD